jgi:hypothetical protein
LFFVKFGAPDPLLSEYLKKEDAKMDEKIFMRKLGDVAISAMVIEYLWSVNDQKKQSAKEILAEKKKEIKKRRGRYVYFADVGW